jgi:hypothetical protein
LRVTAYKLNTDGMLREKPSYTWNEVPRKSKVRSQLSLISLYVHQISKSQNSVTTFALISRENGTNYYCLLLSTEVLKLRDSSLCLSKTIIIIGLAFSFLRTVSRAQFRIFGNGIWSQQIERK